MSGSNILEVAGLKKSYGKKQVVDGIDLTVRKGDILGYLGPNGAGKSTSVRVITGIERSDGGSVAFEGVDTQICLKKMQQSIGVVPQDLAFYEDMSAYRNVDFFCALYGYGKKERKERVREALEFVGLWEKRAEMPGTFSGGMKRRLNIACSITNSPKLLIMDEPTVGIDPQSRNHIMQAIRILNHRGTTIVYVSHYMEEIEELCNRIVIVDHGRVIVDQEKEELLKADAGKAQRSLEEIFLDLTGTAFRDEE